MAATVAPLAARRTPWLRNSVVTLAILLALALGGAISLSKPFQQGSTRLFGKVVDGVKDHPRATVGIALGSVAALWLGIGAGVAGQELRTRRREPPNRD